MTEMGNVIDNCKRLVRINTTFEIGLNWPIIFNVENVEALKRGLSKRLSFPRFLNTAFQHSYMLECLLYSKNICPLKDPNILTITS